MKTRKVFENDNRAILKAMPQGLVGAISEGVIAGIFDTARRKKSKRIVENFMRNELSKESVWNILQKFPILSLEELLEEYLAKSPEGILERVP